MLSASAAQRLYRVANGTLANILGQVLNAGSQLAMVPILLRFWGNQVYGEWLALSAMAAYLTTLDLGMQTYVVNRLNQCYSLNQMDEYTRVLQSGLLINLAIPVAGLCLALPLLFVAPIAQLLQLHATLPSTAAWVAAILSCQMVLAIEYGLLAGIYRTINEYARGQMVTNVRLILSLVLTVVLAMAGGRMRALAFLQLALMLAATAFVYFDISRRRPDIRIGLTQADWRLGLRFIGPSSMFLGIQIVMALAVQGTTLMVNFLFGAATLVVFASLRTLSNLIKQAAATVQLALWPEFTSLDAQAKSETLRILHLLGAKIAMTTAVCSTVFLIIVGDRLVAFWTQGRVPYDPALMSAFLMLACSQAHWCTSSVLISASNRQKLLLQWTTLSTLAGFAAGFVAAQWFGVVGFVYGLAAADAVLCGFTLPLFACRIIGESRVRFFSEVTIRSVLLLGATYGAVKVVLPLAGNAGSDVRDFLAAGVVTCAFGAAAAYGVTLNRFERNRVNAAVAGIFTR